MKAAIYARFSTDRQTESSIKDQVRVCAEFAHREDMRITETFEDHGISGAAIGNRPGFLAMMKAAQERRFDVLIVMDLSRLSRSTADLAKAIDRLTFAKIRVIGVQDGFDSSREGHELVSGLSGIIGQQFRQMISKKTYAALESRAQRGDPTGGRAYGYRDGEAQIVREIFEAFAAGQSTKSIALELNRRGVASPGSSWNRSQRRQMGWCASAIHGDPKRGIGILNNELYIGRDVWNRTAWVKNPDTGRRVATLRPTSQWIVREVPEKRLISNELWTRVKARQARRSADIGDRISAGIKKSMGRGPRHLFSTLMKCAECGGNFVVANGTRYACSRYLNGRACTNGTYLKRRTLERNLLKTIRESLLAPETEKEFLRRMRRALTQPDSTAPRKRELEAQIARMVDAIAGGIKSIGLKARLEAAETELDALSRQSVVVDSKAMIATLPRAAAIYRTMAEDLCNAPLDVHKTRNQLRDLVGEIRISRQDGQVIAEMGGEQTPINQAVGGQYIGVVAGARSYRYRHSLEVAV